jgi:hypothetical protein
MLGHQLSAIRLMEFDGTGMPLPSGVAATVRKLLRLITLPAGSESHIAPYEIGGFYDIFGFDSTIFCGKVPCRPNP